MKHWHLKNKPLVVCTSHSIFLAAFLIAFVIIILGCNKTEEPSAVPHESNTTSHTTTFLRDLKQAGILEEKDNIVLLVIDTLRADHLPFYGYKDTAPFLNTLAKRSVVFEEAMAGCSSTAPSMASIFTSTYPSQHGVITGKKATARLQEQNPTLTLNRIPSRMLTLPELITGAGYRGFGVSDNLNIDAPMGYIDGFEEFHTFRYKGAPTVNETILNYAEKLPKDEGHFLYIHYMDPHSPYKEHKKWADKNEENSALRAYDTEIRYTDEHIKKLFNRFHWEENSLIIFFSDHGEELRDRGKLGHGRTLFPEVIHVPLFIYHRNLKARRVATPVHTIDILPTLSEIIGVPAVPYWEGKSLVPFLKGETPEHHDHVYSQLLRHKDHPGVAWQAGLDDENWFIIEKEDSTNPLIYNRSIDPLALTDLFGSPTASEKTTSLKGAITELSEKKAPEVTETVEIEMDNDTVETLRTLGYVQ